MRAEKQLKLINNECLQSVDIGRYTRTKTILWRASEWAKSDSPSAQAKYKI